MSEVDWTELAIALGDRLNSALLAVFFSGFGGGFVLGLVAGWMWPGVLNGVLSLRRHDYGRSGHGGGGVHGQLVGRSDDDA